MTAAVETTMNYYLDPSRGGSKACSFGTAGALRRKFDSHPIQVHDLRGREREFDIHTHAFQLCSWEPSITSLDSDDIMQVLHPEAEVVVKRLTGATRAYCFSHLIRQHTVESNLEALKKLESSRGAGNVSDKEGLGNTVPARHAHVDQSGKGARTLLGDHLPADEVERLTKTRWGTVNLWRPIRTIQRDPLCYCDGRTVEEEDLVPMNAAPPPRGTNKFYELFSRGDGFQTLEIRANRNHKWYYLSGMRPDEALVFKSYDTKNTSQSRCCHSSFTQPQMARDPPRESMEMRFFVFYEDEPLEGF